MMPLPLTRSLILTFIVSLTASLVSSWARAQAPRPEKPIALKNVTLVGGHSNPIFVDLFETNYAEYLELGGKVSLAVEPWRPARVARLSDARRHCSAKGMRVPTTEEWMRVATALGQNKRFTIAGDRLPELWRPVVGRADIEHPHNTRALGIDAAGTLALTGNLREWTQDPQGRGIPCGGSYRSNPGDIELKDLCDLDRATDLKERTIVTGVRCVADFDPSRSYELTYSAGVSSRHREYLSLSSEIESALISSPKGRN